MKYTFLILTYHRPKLLKTVIAHHRFPRRGNSETIIIDNGNGAAFPVARNYETVRYVKTGYNMGVAKGWNLGLRMAQGELIFLIEDDILLPDGWFAEATALYDDLGDALGVIAWNAGHRLDTDESNVLPVRDYGAESSQLKHHQLCLRPKGDVYGSALLGRHLLSDVGYFDERYGLLGYCRTDYGYRCHRLGYLSGYLLRDHLIDRAEHLDTAPDPAQETHLRIARTKYIDKMSTIRKLTRPPKHYFQYGLN